MHFNLSFLHKRITTWCIRLMNIASKKIQPKCIELVFDSMNVSINPAWVEHDFTMAPFSRPCLLPAYIIILWPRSSEITAKRRLQSITSVWTCTKDRLTCCWDTTVLERQQPCPCSQVCSDFDTSCCCFAYRCNKTKELCVMRIKRAVCYCVAFKIFTFQNFLLVFIILAVVVSR